MSYILDALRRAESERERGQVPGLNAQPVPAALGETDKGRPALGRRNLVGAAAALMVLAAGGWWWTRPASEPVRVAPGMPGDVARTADSAAAATAAAPAQIAPVSPPVPATAPGPALLVAPPAPPQAAVMAPAPAPRTTEPPPKPVPEPAANVVSPPATPITAVAPNAVATKPAAGASAAAPARATLLSELSSAQRAELPPMAIGGAIYSDQASSRFVVINGQVVREGETAAPGVVLERIAPKAAVIRWREMRVELPI